MPDALEPSESTAGDASRRSAILDAALTTFARYGYGKTSMDAIAVDAHISRPGLYFLFSSKGALFRAAMERAIDRDLEAAECALSASARPLLDRIVDAFDRWAGRYLGPLRDVPSLVEQHRELIGPIALAGPARFERMLADAVAAAPISRNPDEVVATLVSVSIGTKHQAADRDDYLARMRVAARLILGDR